MFGFIKKMFAELLCLCTILSFGESLVFNCKAPIKCVSLNNQSCQARSTIINIKSDETLFYPFTISVNKCSGSCSTTDDPYARVCTPKKVKNTNIKVFNLMSGINETILTVQHESCKCKFGLNESVCNSK